MKKYQWQIYYKNETRHDFFIIKYAVGTGQAVNLPAVSWQTDAGQAVTEQKAHGQNIHRPVDSAVSELALGTSSAIVPAANSLHNSISTLGMSRLFIYMGSYGSFFF